MSDEEKVNINLLPGHHEVERARAPDAGGKIEYTEPEAAQVVSAPTEASPKVSWWSRLAGKFKRVKAPASEAADLTALPPPPPPEAENGAEQKETPSAPEETQPEEIQQEESAEPGLEVNLLSAEYAQTFAVARQKEVLLWALVVTFLFLAVLYLSALWLEKTALTEVRRVEAASNELQTVIGTYKDMAKEDTALRRKLTAIKALLKRHVSLKLFLEKLESVTIPEVAYLNIAVSGSGGLNMAARADSYTSVARQLTVFSQSAPWIKEVNLTSVRLAGEAGAKERGVAFDLSLKVDENAFLINPPPEQENAAQQ